MPLLKPQPDAEPIPGYRLRRYLGRGGFGEVWEAEAPGGLAKAIKIAPVETVGDTITCRELDGLTKIRSVRHPYLLSIERFEIVDGYLVIVMELADQSLADFYAERHKEGGGGIERAELIRYLNEAAEVLDLLALGHGLQHLDVKPENLFLSGDHVKVADFGLVQTGNTNICRAAVAISPPYAPPELFDGRIEITADQYSLAVTYQELLTGTRPYNGADVRTLMLQHLKGLPDLSALPPGDRPIISRALHRDPSARYPDCRSLMKALERAPRVSPKDVSARAPSITPTPSRLRVSRALSAEAIPAREHVVRPRDNKDAKRSSHRTISLAHGPTEDLLVAGEVLEASFVAFLPAEIYAHKLRGFVEAMNADLLECSVPRTVLYLGPHDWLGRPNQRGLFLSVDTYAKNPHTGFRVCDLSVWSAGRMLTPAEIGRRGILLVRCLKAYLMAVEELEKPFVQTDAEIRAAILT